MSDQAQPNPTLTARTFRARIEEMTEILNATANRPEVLDHPEIGQVVDVLGEMILMVAAGVHQALLLTEGQGRPD